jgi:hypothetical protein
VAIWSYFQLFVAISRRKMARISTAIWARAIGIRMKLVFEDKLKISKHQWERS